MDETGRKVAVPVPAVVVVGGGNRPPPLRHEYSQQQPPPPLPPLYAHAVAAAAAAAAADNEGRGGGTLVAPFQAAFAEAGHSGSESAVLAAEDGDVGNGGRRRLGGGGSGGGGAIAKGDATTIMYAGRGRGGGAGVGPAEGGTEDGPAEPALVVTTSTADTSAGKRDEPAQASRGGVAAGAAYVADGSKPASDEVEPSSSTSRGVAEAAEELALNCSVPGVTEAATAVSILVNLVTDNRDNKNGADASLRRCRSIVLMLQRAEQVLGKGGETHGRAERAMLEDVHDSIFDLVELVKTYQSKSKLSQLLVSALLRRRQDELGAVVDRAISSFQFGLHVQVRSDVNAIRQDVSEVKKDVSQRIPGGDAPIRGEARIHTVPLQGSIAEAQSVSLAETRRARRQRKLDQLEIPEAHVTITNELLGKGGFGEVYLADYNGRNAAAKVLRIDHKLGGRGDNEVLDGSREGELRTQREKSLHKAFLRELEAIYRLRGPHTIDVYGAVTSLPDRLVLVMELLAGGDLRTLLRNSEQPLPEQKSRQIIGDICAGMAFLHSKETVHGDLKSANVLLDGACRATIGDFGTSRWTHHTMSTCLATFTTNSSQNTQMSLAWSAPEMFHVAASTYASDVYSFGVVVWEVLSRELPWADVTHPRDLCTRVVLNALRPAMPDGAPTEIADVARACWVERSEDRPTFSVVMRGKKANRWNQ